MARNLVLVLFAIATLLHGSAAQTRHVVGDAIGWTIPSGGAAAYTTWAANNTFKVGDSLVFNFTTGQHDAVKVSKSAYDACNGASPLLTLTTGPATVTLNETGEQYYICTFGSHCSLGQKLAINVSSGSSASPPSGSPPTQAPAPTPTSPTPSSVPAPAPGPSTGPVTFTVGGSSGWIVPSAGPSFYTSWASGKIFRVGDILVFNYPANAHNVEEVTKANYDACNSTSPLATYTTPPVRVTLKKTGSHYFICGVPGHCSGGQKLAINVTTGSATTTSPSPSPSPSSVATPPSGSSSSPPPSSTNPSSPSPEGAVTPPPRDSGAASLANFGIFTTLLSVAAAFFY